MVTKIIVRIIGKLFFVFFVFLLISFSLLAIDLILTIISRL